MEEALKPSQNKTELAIKEEYLTQSFYLYHYTYILAPASTLPRPNFSLACFCRHRYNVSNSNKGFNRKGKKMMYAKKITLISMVLLCGFVLIGCKDSAKEEAVAEASAAKIELSKVKLELAAVTEARDKLQAIAGQATNIKEKLTVLTQERDATIAKATGAQTMVENLKTQLSDQLKKVTELQGQNTKLQEIIDGLKKKLGGEIEVPSLPAL